MTEIQKLKALAEAATPGPWEAVDYGDHSGMESEWYVDTSFKKADITADEEGVFPNHWDGIRAEKDMSFIAAANPAAVLELIAEIERLKHEKRTGDQACRSGLARERIYTDISMALIKNHPHERIGVDWDYEHPLHDLIIGILSERDQFKADNEALRKDAERYRWLMKTGLHTTIYASSAAVAPGRGPYICVDLPSCGAPNRVALGSGADGYIDAAMSKEASHG